MKCLPPTINSTPSPFTNSEVDTAEQDTAHVLNIFFSNIVANFKIPEYADYDPVANNISDPILKLIVRYRNHRIILTIGEVYNNLQKLSFSFSQKRMDIKSGSIIKYSLQKY